MKCKEKDKTGEQKTNFPATPIQKSIYFNQSPNFV
jgi:hypothetical protein